MEKEDAQFLNQLLKSLEDAYTKLEKSYNKNDTDGFDKAKEIIIKIQKEIFEIINGKQS